MDYLDVPPSLARLAGELAPALAADRVRHGLTHPRRLPPRDWEVPPLSAARPVEFRFGLSGLRWGNKGPVVLALHGWEGRATQFRYIAEALVRAGRTVIAIDGPAHGRSPGDEAHPPLFAQALAEVAGEIRDVETVIGHSMGAAAASYALANGLSAERAVLIAGPSSYETVVRSAAKAAGFGPRATVELLRQMEAHTGVAPEAMEIGRLASRIEIPTLVVHDREDTFVDFANAGRIVSGLPDGRLLETRGLGHWRVLTDVATVSRIAAFAAHGPLEVAHAALAA